MRLRWCALALRAFVARWGVLLLVTCLVVGGGSNGPVAAVGGVAGWLVLPLALAATRGWWLLPAWLAQALLGAALVWGARAMLWPVAWREAERALPLRRAQSLRSDALVVACALLPLWALEAAGAGALLASGAPWLLGHRMLAMLALASAAAASLGLGVLLLQRMRRLPQPRAAHCASTAAARPAPWLATGTQAARHGRRPAVMAALVWLPLWRGPARRTGLALAMAAAALCAPAVGLAWRPGWAGWWLAAWALLALLATSRLATLARLEFSALHAACAHLPLQPQRLQHARQALPLAALLPGLAALGLALTLAASAWPGPAALVLRPAVLAGYGLACVGSCAVEACSAPADAAAKSSRWLLSLALCIALASEATA